MQGRRRRCRGCFLDACPGITGAQPVPLSAAAQAVEAEARSRPRFRAHPPPRARPACAARAWAAGCVSARVGEKGRGWCGCPGGLLRLGVWGLGILTGRFEGQLRAHCRTQRCVLQYAASILDGFLALKKMSAVSVQSLPVVEVYSTGRSKERARPDNSSAYMRLAGRE